MYHLLKIEGKQTPRAKLTVRSTADGHLLVHPMEGFVPVVVADIQLPAVVLVRLHLLLGSSSVSHRRRHGRHDSVAATPHGTRRRVPHETLRKDEYGALLSGHSPVRFHYPHCDTKETSFKFQVRGFNSRHGVGVALPV